MKSTQIAFASIVVLALASIILAGCINNPSKTASTATPLTTPVTAPSTSQVHITATGFSPAVLVVTLGSSVVFTNDDSQSHDVVFVDGESAILQKEGTYQRTFSQEGVYSYVDGIGSAGEGEIQVKAEPTQ